MALESKSVILFVDVLFVVFSLELVPSCICDDVVMPPGGIFS